MVLIRFDLTQKITVYLLEGKLGIQDKFVVLSIGRLAKQKGIDVLLQAAALLKNQTQNRVVVLIGGRGEGRKCVEKGSQKP